MCPVTGGYSSGGYGGGYGGQGWGGSGGGYGDYSKFHLPKFLSELALGFQFSSLSNAWHTSKRFRYEKKKGKLIVWNKHCEADGVQQ